MNDYISREAAKKCIQEWLTKAKYPANKSKYNEGEIAAYETSIDTIDELPAADVAEVGHGKWTPVVYGAKIHICSRCSNYAPMFGDGSQHRSAYCPFCGAKMDEAALGGDGDAVP